MDILNWLMDNVLSILIAAGGAIAWLSERRKRKADIAGVEVVTAQGNAEVFQKMRNSYNEFVLDLNTRLDELRNENAELKKRDCRTSQTAVGSGNGTCGIDKQST